MIGQDQNDAGSGIYLVTKYKPAGCGVEGKDGTRVMSSMDNPFVMYRAAWILSRLQYRAELIELAISAARYDDLFTSDESIKARGEISKMIGQTTYHSIMSEVKVPPKVIEAVLSYTLHNWLAIGWMTEEIRRGTIEWQARFAEYGVSTPEEADRRKKLVEPYQNAIETAQCVCQVRGLPVTGHMVIEYVITQLIDGGYDTAIGMDEKSVVALAILVLHLYWRDRTRTKVRPIDPVVQVVLESGLAPSNDDLLYIVECVGQLFPRNSTPRQRLSKRDELLALYRRFVNSA